jgi:pentatricopeptide repeat protein
MATRGAVFRSPALTLTLHATMPLERHEQDVRGTFTLRAGENAGVVLESAADGPPKAIDAAEVRALADQTADFWRQWLDSSTYTGRWRETVQRSAMTLKMMIYAPTGAPVAAVTTGLPEQIGGERNWDYRYTWIRDASFSVHALLGLGYREEANAFMHWVSARIDEAPDGKRRPLQIMYRVDGSAELHEETLDHFEGYKNSRPVRIGNEAADQLQLDIYGEALDSLYTGDRQGLEVTYQGWARLSGLMEWLCDHWDEPEEGIWETRGGRQNFTYGRLMSWVAFDRVIRLATEHGLPADLPRLTATRDAIYRQIMEKGWNAKRGAFVQHYATDVLDASLLMMPLVGFIVPQDPRWLSTLQAMDSELVSDSLVYRYDPTASPDGLRGVEGTFSIATYWYVDALARSGRLDDARLVFEKMTTYGNHLGLYSEQIGVTGEQQGNFPQAFTHLALINAALNLNYQLDHGAGRVGVDGLGSSGSAK